MKRREDPDASSAGSAGATPGGGLGRGAKPPSERYEVVIGLEVHAQLLTRAKMFCGCPTTFGAPPNTQTCPVCLGMPGVLPVVNRRAIEFAVRTALAFNGGINERCRFARKHYYYPDMPKNFQISQYEEPLAEEGWLEIDLPGGASRRIGIQRLHLEEDVGKLVHEGTLETAQASLVDFNRAGVPLMETVSRPEIRSPEEAAAYLRAFRAVLVYLGVCDGNMEEGSLRCDANVSLRPRGAAELGTKVEIKNMNSFRNVQRALEYEVQRQARALDAGERIVQETRLWEADRGYTRSMRSKEYAHDYRYFPEPDLVPLALDHAWVEEIRRALPELPRARRQRFVSQHGLPPYDADVLTASRALADYFEGAVRELPNAKAVSNWVMSELLRVLPGDDERAIEAAPVTPSRLAGLLRLIEDGTISGKIAKDVFEKMWRTGEDARTLVEREGLTQVADTGALERILDEVIAANPRPIEDWKKGKTQAAKALVGLVMKATGGKANPAIVNRLLEEKLSRLE
jgi:aspartyl-tRNA(Asn)/glutamyl-tRNA(Gln) amidotransferase subunit B